MKKSILGFALAFILILSMSVNVFAETVSINGGNASAEVKGSYAAMDQPATVYYVDVAWGSMEFTYDAGSVEEVWNPETHEYDKVTTKGDGWQYAEEANEVTVTNRSNKAITATVMLLRLGINKIA